MMSAGLPAAPPTHPDADAIATSLRKEGFSLLWVNLVFIFS